MIKNLLSPRAWMSVLISLSSCFQTFGYPFLILDLVHLRVSKRAPLIGRVFALQKLLREMTQRDIRIALHLLSIPRCCRTEAIRRIWGLLSMMLKQGPALLLHIARMKWVGFLTNNGSMPGCARCFPNSLVHD